MPPQLKIKQHSSGGTYLHTWRTGTIYYRYNREVTLRDWTSLIHSFHCNHVNAEGTLVYDSRRGIPAPDASFNGIYSCHVLEHMVPEQARFYMGELLRVMKPGAICRVSTPDLELQAREYVAAVEAAVKHQGNVEDRRYELTVRTLIDQFTRLHSGGRLLDYFQGPQRDDDHARTLFGAVVDEFLPVREQKVLPNLPAVATKRQGPFRNPREFLDRLKMRLLRRTARNSAQAIGETELWRWDRYSLGKLYTEAGFADVTIESSSSSRLPVWKEHGFDTLATGETIETSIFFEAAKPA